MRPFNPRYSLPPCEPLVYRPATPAQVMGSPNYPGMPIRHSGPPPYFNPPTEEVCQSASRPIAPFAPTPAAQYEQFGANSRFPSEGFDFQRESIWDSGHINKDHTNFYQRGYETSSEFTWHQDHPADWSTKSYSFDGDSLPQNRMIVSSNLRQPQSNFRGRPFGIQRTPSRRDVDQNNTIRRRPPPMVYCELCKVGCAGSSAYKEHVEGQRHKKRQAQADAVARLTTDRASDPSFKKSVSTKGVVELHCTLCDVFCTGAEAYAAHLTGKQHNRTVRLHKDLGKAIPDVKTTLSEPPTSDSESIQKATADKKQSPPEPAKTKATKPLPEFEKPAVGAEFVESITGPSQKATHFHCKLCECSFTNNEAKEFHLRGRRHRMQYKKKVDSSLEIESKSHNRSSPHKSPVNGQEHFSETINQSSGWSPSPYAFSQHPNVSAENRYIGAKHATLLPSTTEIDSLKAVIRACELSLKNISDQLMAAVTETESRDSSNSDQNRLLRGVMHVGPFGEALLLRGEHVGHLVVVCSEWPTTDLTDYLAVELEKSLETQRSGYVCKVEAVPSSGEIIVHGSNSCDDYPLKQIGDQPVDLLPTVTIRLQLTSPLALASQKNGDSANGVDGSSATDSETTSSKEPLSRGHLLVAKGARIERCKCIDAFDAINQTKWFQSVSLNQSLVMVARVIRDFLRTHEHWSEMNQFAVLALLERLLGVRNPTQASPNLLHRPLTSVSQSEGTTFSKFRNSTPFVANLYGPGRIFRRFFEAIASGLLLRLEINEKKPDSSSGKYEPEMFYPLSLFARLPMQTRELITSSAQHYLRQIAFRKLFEVLKMEPFVTPYNKVSAFEVKPQFTNITEETSDVEIPQEKRRRLGVDETTTEDYTNDNKDSGPEEPMSVVV